MFSEAKIEQKDLKWDLKLQINFEKAFLRFTSGIYYVSL